MLKSLYDKITLVKVLDWAMARHKIFIFFGNSLIFPNRQQIFFLLVFPDLDIFIKFSAFPLSYLVDIFLTMNEFLQVWYQSISLWEIPPPQYKFNCLFPSFIIYRFFNLAKLPWEKKRRSKLTNQYNSNTLDWPLCTKTLESIHSFFVLWFRRYLID